MANARTPQARYALVVLLPRVIEAQIEDAFLSLVGITRPIMGFHITLVGPFQWLHATPQHALDRLARLCRHTRPFEVTVAGLGAFVSEESSAVYLRVAPNRALCRLQARALRLLRPHILLQQDASAEDYVPHVTLGLGLTPEERDRALASMADERFGAIFTVTEVHLVKEELSSPWRPIMTFPLAGQPLDDAQRIHER